MAVGGPEFNLGMSGSGDV